jgi:hypothetical protein
MNTVLNQVRVSSSPQENDDDMDIQSPIYVSYYLENINKVNSPTLVQKQMKYEDFEYTMVNCSKDGTSTKNNVWGASSKILAGSDAHITDELDEEDEWEMVKSAQKNDQSAVERTEEGLYRSVVYSTITQKPVCMALPKSISFDDFLNTPNLTRDMIYINEIIEGTMINLFFDVHSQRWILCTKNRVGADHFFYRTDYTPPNIHHNYKYQYTFYEMFMEAIGGHYSDDLNTSPIIKDLPKNCCYNFVLQHPMNHIVLPIIKPAIYLVQVYEIIENIVLSIPVSIYQSWECFQGSISFPCFFPKQYLLDPTVDNVYVKLEEIRQQYVTNVNTDTPPMVLNFMGWMIHNTTNGDRASLRCPIYEQLKLYRGNHPNLQYHYLVLEQDKSLSDFLKFFPNYTNLFSYFNHLYSHFITMVHYYYVAYYVKKEQIIIPQKYAAIVFKLHHQIYLPSLNQISEMGEVLHPRIVTIEVVREYTQNMNTKVLYYYLNYDRIHDTPNIVGADAV